MRTSDFITALSADPIPEPIRLGRRIGAALIIGFPFAHNGFGQLIGVRKSTAARPIGADKIGVAEFACSVGAVVLTPRP